MKGNSKSKRVVHEQKKKAFKREKKTGTTKNAGLGLACISKRKEGRHNRSQEGSVKKRKNQKEGVDCGQLGAKRAKKWGGGGAGNHQPCGGVTDWRGKRLKKKKKKTGGNVGKVSLR